MSDAQKLKRDAVQTAWRALAMAAVEGGPDGIAFEAAAEKLVAAFPEHLGGGK